MRWGVPVAAIAVVAGALGAGPVIAAVQGEPTLPDRTAQQLLADAVQAARAGAKPMSGTVIQTASLGLPGLPEVAGVGGSSPAALLAGSHELKVWYGGADRIRLALPGRMSETDLIANGDQTWLWESDANRATRIKGADGLAHDRPATALPTATTPQQVAQELLKRTGADTTVSVTSTERVADRPAYQLVLAPKDSASLIKEVKLALDGETLVPLRVQVYARSAAEPAFEIGFTSVTFTPPAAGNFTFTPPAGARVVEQTLGESGERLEAEHDRAQALKGGVKTVGEGWTSVAVLPFSGDALTAQPAQGQDQEQRQGGGRSGQDVNAIVQALLRSAKPISGTWGTGRVVQTKLVSALLTDDGRLLVGAVTPEKLAEAAGKK
ncbi:DUF2092 domain-containing protein [Streptosporangium sp. NPDC051023]|uniref:LolA family protein n=1 Tax=Streptosporangium sp. NPDC051023 TaxID=3155410 RepID=UPI00344C13D6